MKSISKSGRAELLLCLILPPARAAWLTDSARVKPEGQNIAALVLAGSLGGAAAPPYQNW